ncbi:MAG: polyprenyl synthetase family protein [Mesorhizobium sp.]
MTGIDAGPFEGLLAGRARQVEDMLRRLLDGRPQPGEIVRPERLLQAMRHGVLNGGKRLRPFLVLESALLFEADPEQALHVAAALEAIHCYSLIHDDLPAMDDDDLRRGQPTVHRAFDEASAILAGDALLTLAFDAVTSPEAGIAPVVAVDLVRALSRAAGMGGMVGGQALDLQAEQVKPDENGVITLQAMKTGALIRFACEAGAILGKASENDRERMIAFGSAIGLAFQLADDLLDLTSDSSRLGKRAGKDAAAGKATLPALHGVDWTRRELAGLVAQAHELLEPFGEQAAVLKQAASFIANRQN